MKIRILYRQIQEIPNEKWLEQLELERKTDEAELRAGHKPPRRYRMFAGGEKSQIRVHEREYESIAEWGKLFEEWADNEELQALEVERRNYYTWEREEIYYVDDPNDPIMPWMKMITLDPNSKEKKYVVDPNWKDK